MLKDAQYVQARRFDTLAIEMEIRVKINRQVPIEPETGNFCITVQDAALASDTLTMAYAASLLLLPLLPPLDAMVRSNLFFSSMRRLICILIKGV